MAGPELLAALLGPDLAIAGAAALAAGVVRGLVGFGGALVMVPILSLLFGPAPAVAVVIALELLGFLQLLPGAVRHVRWRELAPMSVAALAVLPLGAWLVVHVAPEVMRRTIGGIVVALGLLLLWGRRAARRPGLPAALGVAGVSGLLQGLAGTPGPPVVLFLLAGPDSAAANRHQLVGYFAVLDTAGLLLFAAQGTVDGLMLGRIALLLPLSVAGTWLGARLFYRAREALLRRLALALIIAIGLLGLLY